MRDFVDELLCLLGTEHNWNYYSAQVVSRDLGGYCMYVNLDGRVQIGESLPCIPLGWFARRKIAAAAKPIHAYLTDRLIAHARHVQHSSGSPIGATQGK